MIFNIARRYRIYPNEDQSQIIERTFGACRYIWNQYVEYINSQYMDRTTRFVIPNYGVIAEKTFWLLDKSIKIDRHAVSIVRYFFQEALSRYYNSEKKYIRKDGKPKGFPKFKSKKMRNSFSSYNHIDNLKINFETHTLKLNCMNGLMSFDKREKPIPSDWKITHYTISRKAGKYYCSICFEYEDDRLHEGLNFIQLDESKYIGLDYKSDGLYIDSNGQCAEYPKYYRKSQKRLRMLQKKYSRQQKGGKNNEKTLLKIQQFHDHISNQRKDFLHKLSTAITKQYDVICAEDIDMRAMGQCLKLGKSTMDNGFGMFREMLTYKALCQPMKFVIKVGRFYPSSKTCSYCGYKLDTLKLSDRVFNCPKCKHSIDRDFNAAINIRDEGFRIIKEEMHGFYER